MKKMALLMGAAVLALAGCVTDGSDAGAQVLFASKKYGTLTKGRPGKNV